MSHHHSDNNHIQSPKQEQSAVHSPTREHSHSHEHEHFRERDHSHEHTDHSHGHEHPTQNQTHKHDHSLEHADHSHDHEHPAQSQTHDHNHDHAGTAPHSHGHHHDPKQRQAVVHRIARAAGHLNAVKRMVEDDRDCSDILIQLAAVQSALNSVSRIILKDHIEHCIVDAVEENDSEAIDRLNKAIDQMIK